jgi:hypothetical protein
MPSFGWCDLVDLANLAESPWKNTMRFTRFSSDGSSVVEERIWLEVQPDQDEAQLVLEKRSATRPSRGDSDLSPDRISQSRVLAGIDALLRSVEQAA